MTPVPVLRLAPDGSAGDTDHVTGPVAQLVSVAVGVIVSVLVSCTNCGVEIAATATGAVSMVTFAGAPGEPGMSLFKQSRSVTVFTVTAPVPLPPFAATWMSNRSPVAAVAPHGVPLIVPSAVYWPPPLLTTNNVVFGFAPLRYVPSTMFVPAGPHSCRFGDSVNTTWKSRMPVPSVRAMCTGTVTEVCAGVRHVAGPTAATTPPMAKLLSLASAALLQPVSCAVTRTRALAVGVFGTVHA